jgi:hypothetical protein
VVGGKAVFDNRSSLAHFESFADSGSDPGALLAGIEAPQSGPS